jgi:hypothetical protein
MTRILILTAHPDPRLSRVNRRLQDAARALAADTHGRLVVRDLYALYPDYLIDVAPNRPRQPRPTSSSGSIRCTGTACRRC